MVFRRFPIRNGGADFRDKLVDGIQWVINQSDLTGGLSTRHV